MSAARIAPAALAGFDTAPRDDSPPVADVATLLPPIEAVDALPPAALPGVALYLTALLMRVAARQLAIPAPAPRPTAPPEPDMIAEVGEVARIVRRSVSWVRRNGRKLPGFAQPGGKGCKVLWSRRALTECVTGETFPLTGTRRRA